MAKLGLQDRLLHLVGQMVTYYQASAGSNGQAFAMNSGRGLTPDTIN